MFPQEQCNICQGPHDDEIHAATTRVHLWFRSEIARKLVTPDENEEPAMPLRSEPEAAA